MNYLLAGLSGSMVGVTSILVIFKLSGTINWSWWWVLSPVLVAWAVPIAVFIVLALVVILED